MNDIFVSLDLETTGLDPVNDEIIEIGAVKFDRNGVIDTYQSMAKPSRPVPYRIQILTGITDRDLVKAPKLPVALNELVDFLGNATIIGQNIGFDLAFLAEQDVAPRGEVYDVFEMATIVMPALTDYRLATLAAELGVSSVQYHRALHDATAAKDVFLALLDKLRSLDPSIVAELDRIGASRDWPLGRLFHAVSDEKLGDVFSIAGEPALKIYELSKEKGERLRAKTEREKIDIDRMVLMLEDGGKLSKSLEGFECRKEQSAMARAVAEALNKSARLIVEAGTGTGKSIAYLLPSIIFASGNGMPVIVSTNTISLQEQLIGKDIPDLEKALGDVAFRCVQLKGRGNYLCMRRWNLHRRMRSLTREESGFMARILVWLAQTETGDRGELNMRREEQSLWSRVSAQSESCLGSQCPYQKRGQCFLYRARRMAEGAHIVVVNHALLLSDIVSESNILPSYRHLIIDEAHNLEEEATEQWGLEVGERDLRGYFDRLGQRDGGGRYGGLLFELAEHFRGSAVPLTRQHEIGEMAGDAYRIVEHGIDRASELFDALSKFVDVHARDGGGYERRLRITGAERQASEWRGVVLAAENMDMALQDIGGELGRLLAAVEPLDSMLDHDDIVTEIASAIYRGEEMRQGIGWICGGEEEDSICWLSAIEGRVTMHAAPLEVATVLERDLYENKECVVLTGATLSVDGGFGYIKNRLGFGDAREVMLGSPFDFEGAALLYIPDDIPEPGARGYQKAVAQALMDIGRAAEGRTLALFTSHSALRSSYESIRETLNGEDILVLAQGVDGSPRQLIRSLKEDSRTMLLGTSSFWEGVDIAGDSLSVLAIARLPFSVPTDPVFVSRSELFSDPFNEYAVPQAALKFKQGFGRLIRSKSDRGVVVILDSRVRSKKYGGVFLSSLPQCTVKSGHAERLAGEIRDWLYGG
ncbi:MAG: helicase C-terminal domain-containing protein [Dehalococcoidia bacterium]